MMNWEGCDRSLIEELSRILPGRTEENFEKIFNQVNWCPSLESSQEVSEYKTRTLRLEQPVRSVRII
jgi:hypothetical protein